MENVSKEEVCCPKFNPVPWDGKVLEWKDKLFIKDKVFTFFYMPINFGGVMKRLDEKVKKSGANIVNSLCMSDHTSNWNMDIFCAVDKEIPDAENIKMSGKFLSKVYEGDFKDTGIWCKDFQKYAAGKNMKIIKWFMWYTTCPKCAKKYGHNYTVIIGKVG